MNRYSASGASKCTYCPGNSYAEPGDAYCTPYFCKYGCGDHGRCTSDHVCSCHDFYHGTLCQNAPNGLLASTFVTSVLVGDYYTTIVLANATESFKLAFLDAFLRVGIDTSRVQLFSVVASSVSVTYFVFDEATIEQIRAQTTQNAIVVEHGTEEYLSTNFFVVQSQSSTNIGVIIGSAFAGAAFLLIVVVILVLFLRARRFTRLSDTRATTMIVKGNEAVRKDTLMSDEYLDLGLSTNSLYLETFASINSSSNRYRPSAAWANNPSFFLRSATSKYMRSDVYAISFMIFQARNL